MIVWFFHVKVGHRQTPFLKPPTDVGGFYMPVGSVGLMTRAFLLFKLKDDNYVVILEHKVPKVTVNCLEYLKSNGICVIMSYAFI